MNNINDLAQKWLAAKSAEKQANDTRLAIEAQLCDALGTPTEGQETAKTDRYAVTVKQTITRKLDERAYALIEGKIPEAVRPVTWEKKAKLDTKGIKWLRENEPGYFKLIATALTETPAKPSISVEAVA